MGDNYELNPDSQATRYRASIHRRPAILPLLNSALAPGGGGLSFLGFTESAADPTTDDYPSDKSWGFHRNTGSGDIFLTLNDAGSIIKVQLT